MKREGAKQERVCRERFPIGAWVTATDMPWYNGLEKDGHGGVRFTPKSGEIVAIGALGPMPMYQVKFGRSYGFISVQGAACYHCWAENDESHRPGCVELPLRRMPHTPGFFPIEGGA